MVFRCDYLQRRRSYVAQYCINLIGRDVHGVDLPQGEASGSVGNAAHRNCFGTLGYESAG